MPASDQSYQTHRRFLPPYHFFAVPVLVVNVLVELARLVRAPTLYHGWLVVFACGLVSLALMARLMAVTVQNRVIRLEERLRLQRLMPAGEHAAVAGLTLGHLVALRFASDEEAPGLARRCAAGELRSSGEVKQQIRTWREDTLRV